MILDPRSDRQGEEGGDQLRARVCASRSWERERVCVGVPARARNARRGSPDVAGDHPRDPEERGHEEHGAELVAQGDRVDHGGAVLQEPEQAEEEDGGAL